jgi:glycosyltransferase involved in cell wall biosynthesis
MDLGCCIPYYMSYLCRALRARGVAATLGSVNYHFDPGYFAAQGLSPDPGLVDWASHVGQTRPRLRRVLRVAETLVNLAALSVRFAVKPPRVLHVEYLVFTDWGFGLELHLLRLARRRGIPVVYTAHNLLPHGTGRRLEALFRRLYALPDRIICLTQAAQAQLVADFAVPPERLRVIPHGPMFHDAPRPPLAEARSRLGLPPDRTIVLCQGLVKPYKGIEFLLESWPEVIRRAPGALLLVAGRGEPAYQESLARLVAELGISATVRLDFRFLPASELPLLFQAADVLVYPYQGVTTSGALMSGINYGKAVVATDLPAFREVLRAGVNAELVPFLDRAALADRLAGLALDPLRRARLGRALEESRRHEDEPSWDRIAEMTQACYEEVAPPFFPAPRGGQDGPRHAPVD